MKRIILTGGGTARPRVAKSGAAPRRCGNTAVVGAMSASSWEGIEKNLVESAGHAR